MTDPLLVADPEAVLPARRVGEGGRLVGPLTVRARCDLGDLGDLGDRGDLGDLGAPSRVLAACVLADGEGSLVAAPLVLDAGPVRRAAPGDGAATALLRLMRAEGPVPDAFELVVVSVPPAGEPAGRRGEVGIAADQTHDSVVAGGAVVKWAVHVEATPGQPPAVAAARHLHATGFAEMPQPYGFLLARTDAGEVLLASAAAYLPGALDGWDWAVDDLHALVAGRLTLDGAVEPARVVGGLVARLHLAFATAYDGCAEPVSWAGATEVAAWGQRAATTLDEALAVTGGKPGERLRARGPAARDALSALARIAAAGTEPAAATPLIRVHGDLHVGQVLRWDGGYAVSDFDGNPVLPARDRAVPQPPARDVAGMLRALDHVGRIVDRRTGGTASGLVDRWIAASRAAFLEAYVRELAAGGRPDLFDARLVRPFEVEQECREYVYAARHLPRWTYVPDAAMGPLLDRKADG